MTTRRSRNLRYYWRIILVAGIVVAASGLSEIVLAIIDHRLEQGILGGVIFILGGIAALLRFRQYRSLTPEQLDQTIPEYRRTKFQFRWPVEEARLQAPEDPPASRASNDRPQ
jgi:hypothetical protein